MAQPQAVGRIGLRFINRIPIDSDQEIGKFIVPAPSMPSGIPLHLVNFMHRDMLNVPGYNYAIDLIKTLQSPNGTPPSIILDIDVFTTDKPELDDNLLKLRLSEMRQVKNSVFFGSVSEQALRFFRGG